MTELLASIDWEFATSVSKIRKNSWNF